MVIKKRNVDKSEKRNSKKVESIVKKEGNWFELKASNDVWKKIYEYLKEYKTVEMKIDVDKINFNFGTLHMQFNLDVSNTNYELQKNNKGMKTYYIDFNVENGLNNVLKDLEEGYMIIKWTEQMPKRVTFELYSGEQNKKITKRTTSVEVSETGEKKRVVLPANEFSIMSKDENSILSKLANVLNNIKKNHKYSDTQFSNVVIQIIPKDNILEIGSENDIKTDYLFARFKLMDNQNTVPKPDTVKKFNISHQYFKKLARMIDSKEFELGYCNNKHFIRASLVDESQFTAVMEIALIVEDEEEEE